MLTILKKITVAKKTPETRIPDIRAYRGLWYILFYAIVSMVLAGCSNTIMVADKIEQTDAQLYQSSLQQLLHDHKEAIKSLDEIEQYYPYSNLIQKAKILKLYAYYINQKFDDSQLASEAFLHYYPGSEYASYADYMLAMSYYMQIADVGRDQKVTENALAALGKVRLLYPGTKYAKDAYSKEQYAIAMLAAKDMEIGRFYQKQGDIGAALGRFESVLANNSTSVVIPEALYRLVACYYEIGMNERAKQFAALLHYNFNDSEWDIYAKDLLVGQNNKNKSKKVLPGVRGK